jgi:hypothetical protein
MSLVGTKRTGEMAEAHQGTGVRPTGQAQHPVRHAIDWVR